MKILPLLLVVFNIITGGVFYYPLINGYSPVANTSGTINKDFASVNGNVIKFPDPNLESAVRSQINMPRGDLKLSDIKKITYLPADHKNISNLEGIEYLVNLNNLWLQNNRIGDITPLSKLTKLTRLYLSGNRISNIDALAKLTNLTDLWLDNNRISDIRPLEKLAGLTRLLLDENNIVSAGVLKKLTKLTNLRIWRLNSLKKVELVEQKAKKVIGTVIKAGMSDYGKELALHDYIILNTRYDIENFNNNTVPEDSYNPYGILIKGTGVCQGYAETMKILLNMAGIDCTVVGGEAGKIQHAWNIVKIGGEYYHLDATWDDPVSQDNQNQLKHDYFNLSDIQIGVNHKWPRKKHPACIKDNKMHRKSSLNYALAGDYIYTNAVDGKIYKMKPDGSGKTRINDDQSMLIKVIDNWIYYINADNSKICKISIDGKDSVALNDDDITTWMDISGEWIYYKSFNWETGAGLYKIKTDGSEKIRLGADSPEGFKKSENGVSYTFEENIYLTDNLIYYISQADSGKICKIKLDGSGREILNNDNSYDMDILGDWIYYRNRSDNNGYYKIKTDGTLRQSLNTVIK